MAQRVHLNHETDVDAAALAQLDDSVEDWFPVLVAREIVVGDEIAVDPVFRLCRIMCSTSLGLRRRDCRS